MSLVINSNLMAANAARNLSGSFGALSVSVRRLSSGLRIGTASDDAAGLAIRELMRADITTLNQGVRNANDAISMIQTADGALSVIDEKLIRMQELAEQAATGTYNSDQREIIDSEYQAMASEITRIANSTDFNGIHLLNGNLSGATHIGSGLQSLGQMKIHFGTGNDSAEDYYYVKINSATAASLGLGGSTTEAAYATEQGVTFSSNFVLSASYALPAGYLADMPQSIRDQFDPNQVVSQYGSATQFIVFARDLGGDLHALRSANTGASPPPFLGDVNLTNRAPSVATQDSAQQALETIRTAIISKDDIRASLGALQNRFENTISVLQIQAENMQAAESRISDVDVAQEMTQFVRSQIMSQAAVSMLAQANSMPRMALQLLGG